MNNSAGSIVYEASVDSRQLTAGLKDVEKSVDRVAGSTEKSSGRMTSALKTAGKVGFGALVAGSVAAVALVTSNISRAVNRVDTLVAFPRMLQAMGASADDAKRSTDNLIEGLTGLPTPLEAGAKGVQSLVAAGLEVTEATDSYLAFNNAMLAGNVEANAAEATFTQLTQAISRGKIEGQEWNSITANMPTALQALTKETGLTKGELQELYRTDPQKLLDDLVRLNKEGGGGLASLEEQARLATGGIGTSIALMNTYVSRGIANIIKAIGGGDLEAGQKKISGVFIGIGEAMETSLSGIATFITALPAHIETARGMLEGSGIIGVLQMIGDTFKNIFDNAMIALVPMYDFFMAYILPVLEQIGSYVMGQFKSAWDSIVSTFETLKPVLEVVGAILGVALVASLAILVGGVVAVVTIFSTLVNWSVKLGSFIVELGVTIVKMIVGVVKAGWDFFSGITRAFGDAWNWIKGIWSGVGSWFSGIISAVVGAFRGFPGQARSIFSNAWESIKGIFSGMASWFSNIDLFSAGKAIIRGFIDGIGSMIGRAKEMAGKVVESVRNLFPFSPAKEGPFSGRGYTTYSGKALMEDFASGMQSGASTVNRAAGGILGGVSGAFDNITSPNIGVEGSTTSGGSSRTTTIGSIYLNSDVDADRFIRRLSNDAEIVSSGLVPPRRYA